MTTTILMAEVMHLAPHTISAGQTVEYTKKEMARLNIRHFPILKDGKCVGIISDRDVKLAYAVDGVSVGKRLVTEICSDDVYAVSSDTPLSEVAATMFQRGIGSTVIIDNEKVVGIFTTIDACKVLATRL